MNLFNAQSINLKEGDIFLLSNKATPENRIMFALSQFQYKKDDVAVIELVADEDNKLVGELRLNQGFFVDGVLLDCIIEYQPIVGEA
tara:strand:- start:283 stop:543 length:261 start_codon:yes stop_codon:yes gene_type:complete